MSQWPLSPKLHLLKVSNQKSPHKRDAFVPLFLLNLLPHFCDSRPTPILWRVYLLMLNSFLTYFLLHSMSSVTHPSSTFEPKIISS